MRSLGSIELSYNKVKWFAMLRYNGGHRIPQNHYNFFILRSWGLCTK